MNLIKKFKLKRLMKKIEKELKNLERERNKTLRILESLRDDLREYVDLCYELKILNKEDLKELKESLNKEVNEKLKRIKEEEKKYLMCGIFQAEIKDPSEPLCKGHYFYPERKEFEGVKPFWEEG